MIQLVKYDCGCIGTPPYTDETHKEKSHIIIDCTGHTGEPGLTERDMTGNTYALLPVDDYYKKIIAGLVELISLGYAAKRIQVELSYIKSTLTPVLLWRTAFVDCPTPGSSPSRATVNSASNQP